MRSGIALLLPLCLFGCGGSSSSNGSPVEVALQSSGMSPASISAASGAKIHFVNRDTADHQIASTTCAELASPVLAAGKDFTATLGVGPKTCAVADGLNPNARAFQGTVTVAAPGSGGGGGGGGNGY